MSRVIDSQQLVADSRRIREDLNRAKGYLRRDELVRAVEAAVSALAAKKQNSALGRERAEVEILITEFCTDFSRHPKVVSFLAELGITGAPFVKFKSGDEVRLAKKLMAFRIKWRESHVKAEEAERAAREGQKAEWLEAGQELLNQKNFPRGKVYLRRVAETFGDEAGVLVDVGRRLFAAELHTEASEMFEAALKKFPADQQAYKAALDAYEVLGETAKIEELYLNAVKVFGGHPLTYLNIAKFYYKCHRKEDALEYAQRALGLDPDLAEAKEIVEKTA